ncbi:hypothetical protein Tel_12520 [Candidatus Tenderia electrophaga]|jgi:DNA ligase (NAD+)|uniref:DNA ligase n=1 Tax=Candidatus Tenderia electrophaga TaxID=1748243 RepID=A0A0S2TFJ5_9GAMM|nr:hypothetical protein Tel_12520 [Candidatus Tenderia electrophaga]
MYYVKNQPAIADAVYDQLFARLQALEASYPDLQQANSPTRRVGAEPVSKLKKVRHQAPVLSLEGTLEADQVQSFLKTVGKDDDHNEPQLYLEPKFDGFSVEIVYRQGRFDYGATRGNGEVGEDISHNLRTIGALPLTLQDAEHAPQTLAVRGEVFMPRHGFVELNKQRVERGDKPFANPRNAAAGMMRQLDSRKVAGKPLDIFVYEIISSSAERPASHDQAINMLQRYGLKTSPENQRASSLKQIQRYHEDLAQRRDGLDYEIDGIVVKLDDYRLRAQLGSRDRNPRWALAWKFAPRAEITTLEAITVSVGRTGILTPVALLQPVDVGGVTVSRATLHNADEVKRKDVRVGDRVRIIRAGDVIPEIQARLKQPGKKRHPPFTMPRRCPVCGTEVVPEGAYFLCSAGLACQAQLAGHILHYAANDAMDIDHLGEKTVQQLIDAERVHDLADLYRLKVTHLEALEGFAEKSAKQLYDAIQGAKQARLDRFLYALGIRHVGRHVGRQLAAHFGTLEAVTQADQAAIEAIPEIGPEITASVSHFFAEQRNRKVLQRLQKEGIDVQAMPQRRAQPLKGKTFVFTGTLEHYSRTEAKEQVEMLGGRATSSVSGETDYVVVGSDPGSKREDGRNEGVALINEDEFITMTEGG